MTSSVASQAALSVSAKDARPIPLKVALLLLSIGILVSLAVIEFGLRVAGFSYRLYPEKLEFGYPDFKTMESKYVEDHDLFWTPKDYPQRIEGMIANPPSVVFMGDSCTEFGTYEKRFSRLVRARRPNTEMSYGKVGVAGWASFQGRRQMERDVARIKPKIATVYYGWNDHWIGFGVEDKDVAKLHSPFWSTLANLRFVQLGVKGYLAIGKPEGAGLPQRVSVENYRGNLTAIVRTAKANGITPVLITAPTSQERGKEPAYLKGRFLNSLDDLIPLHQAYIAQVREVAQSEGAVLCDLFNDFAAIPQHVLSNRLFKSSGIHLTRDGNDRIADFLYACFERNGLFTQFEKPKA